MSLCRCAAAGPCETCTANAAALQRLRDNATDALIREMGIDLDDVDRLLEDTGDES